MLNLLKVNLFIDEYVKIVCFPLQYFVHSVIMGSTLWNGFFVVELADKGALCPSF